MKPLIRTIIILTCTLFASVLFHACAPDKQFIYSDLRFDVCDTSELPFRLLSANENVTHGNHVFMARMEVYEVNATAYLDGLIGRSYALSYEVGYESLEQINDLIVTPSADYNGNFPAGADLSAAADYYLLTHSRDTLIGPYTKTALLDTFNRYMRFTDNDEEPYPAFAFRLQQAPTGVYSGSFSLSLVTDNSSTIRDTSVHIHLQ